MKDRFEQILTFYQLSSAQFADNIGVQRSSISHIVSGRNLPSFDFIQKMLLKYPEIDANWLITGKGSLKRSMETNTVPVSKSDPNIFSQNPVKESVIFNKTPDKIDSERRKEAISESKNVAINNEITNVNNVKSIILVYHDDSFKILSGR
ncbi:MAG: helix-turn-helix domain-containing protein [Bacteroidota bacterium]|nr:MAG: helix-turn-helix domain-containing protein [Bacteroidota bacterium]